MGEMMTFPATWEEYEKFYGFTDKEQVYTNGSRLILSFRVKQWLEHLERKRGEWKVCDAKPPTWWYECSVCGNAGNIEYNFCPSCGADMRGEKDVD